MIFRRRSWTLFFVAGVLVGCGSSGSTNAPSSTDVAPGTYVGTVSGSDARVGIVRGASEIVAFFCGSASSLGPDTRWIKSQTNGSSDFAAPPWIGSVHVAGDHVEGNAQPGDGRTLALSASRVADEGPLGVYEQSDGEGRAGVIVYAEDQMQGAFIRSRDNAVLQIVPIKAGRISVENGSFDVMVETRTIRVTRVRAL